MSVTSHWFVAEFSTQCSCLVQKDLFLSWFFFVVGDIHHTRNAHRWECGKTLVMHKKNGQKQSTLQVAVLIPIRSNHSFAHFSISSPLFCPERPLQEIVSQLHQRSYRQ
mmetsp:Transcript_32431/g.78761  ORF Transcript_32431/g.78761 Transcript_32431/m.78761 type:complete len:109 (+) Transcript_32431:186-512(+)